MKKTLQTVDLKSATLDAADMAAWETIRKELQEHITLAGLRECIRELEHEIAYDNGGLLQVLGELGIVNRFADLANVCLHYEGDGLYLMNGEKFVDVHYWGEYYASRVLELKALQSALVEAGINDMEISDNRMVERFDGEVFAMQVVKRDYQKQIDEINAKGE